MKTLPDYREIEIPVTISSLKNYIEPLLYHLGYVRDDEEIVNLKEIDRPDIVMIKVCVKKQQKVDLIKHI